MRSINMLRATMPAPPAPLFEKGEVARVGLAWLATMTVLAGVLLALA
jgi:hypothetical protein